MKTILLSALLATAAFADSAYLPITGNAWRLAPADVNGDGRRRSSLPVPMAKLRIIDVLAKQGIAKP